MLHLSGTIKGGTWSFFSHCARQLLVTWLRRTVNHFKAFNARKNAFKIINVDLGIKLRHMILLTVGIAEEKKYHWLGKTILLLHSSIFMNAFHIITCIDSIPDVPVNRVLLPIKSDIKRSVFPCERLHGCDCQTKLYQWRRMAFSSVILGRQTPLSLSFSSLCCSLHLLLLSKINFY